MKRDMREKYGQFKWDVDDLPRFTYRGGWRQGDLVNVLEDIGALTLWAILFFAAAYAFVVRYDVR